MLRFFDKCTPTTPGGGQRSAADSASMADFGGEDVEQAEAEIESGAPVEIPEVPAIPELPGADTGLDKVATDAAPEATTISADGHAADTRAGAKGSASAAPEEAPTAPGA